MSTPNETDVKRDEGSEAEKKPEIPENWKELPLADMVDKGWRPRIKEMKDRAYLTMRYGTQERSLGPYTQEKWNLLMAMFPKLKILTQKAPPPSEGSLLKVEIGKPHPIRKTADISIQTLAWYEWAQNRGYPGTLGDFFNDVVADYFKREGLSVVILREENQIGN